MADVTSAGTLVAAVLETAGYLTQEEFLQTFSSFFRAAGAVCYMIAAIGAILSVAIFGSYRAARYLLLGPFLFFCAIGVRTDTSGVIWKLGDGKPRGVDGMVSSGTGDVQRYNSAAQVREAAANTIRPKSDSLYTATSVKGSIRVSWFFHFYTSIINSVVNQLVGIILQHENDQDLLFIARTRALDTLVSSRLQGTAAGSIFSDAFIKCEEMMAAALTYASPSASRAKYDEVCALREKYVNGTAMRRFERVEFNQVMAVLAELCPWCDPYEPKRVITYGKEQSEADRLMVRDLDKTLVQIREKNKELKETLARARAVRLTPAPETRTYVADYLKNHPSSNVKVMVGGVEQPEWSCGAGPVNINAARWESAASLIAPLAAKQSWTCGELKQVLDASIWDDAANLWKRVEKAYDPNQSHEANENLLCKELWKKHDPNVDAASACLKGGLAPVASIYLLRNMILDLKESGVVRRHQNRAALIKAESRRIQLVNYPGDSAEKQGVEIVTDAEGTPITDFVTSANGMVQMRVQVEKRNPDGTKNVDWEPYASVGETPGMREAAFGYHQNYQTSGLRQQIFTWALQMPYWQGVILYILALSYPFLALVLVVPGRAEAFLTLPLLWLWVKSWDIGFAFVMILDKVLWNLLPHTTSSQVALEGSEMLSGIVEAMRIDPTYNIHAYYFMLSLSLFSVPMMTAAIVLKGKKSILSSFVDGPKDVAGEAQSRASGAYGVGIMNQNMQQLRSIGGVALTMQGCRGKGVFSGGRGGSAALAGGMAGAGELVGGAIQNAGSGKAYNFKGQAGQDLGEAAAGAFGAAGKELSNRATFEGFHAQSFHEDFGRFGRYQMRLDATNAAMDGGGGFEMNDIADQSYKKLIDLYVGRVETGFDALGAAIGGILGRMGRSAKDNDFADAKAQAGHAMRRKLSRKHMSDIQKLLRRDQAKRDLLNALGLTFLVTAKLESGQQSPSLPELIDMDE